MKFCAAGMSAAPGHPGSSPGLRERLELFLKSKRGLQAALAELGAGRWASQEQREADSYCGTHAGPYDVSPTHCDIRQ